jgi:hypothetical protein
MSTNFDLNELLKNPDQIKQIIGVLSSLLDAAQQADDNKVPETKTTRSVSKIKKTKTKIQRENKFISMPEARMHKEDPELAQKLYKQPPIARNRKNQTMKAKCRVCGREEKIQSSLLYGGIERFKCNKCSTTPG